MQLSRTGLLVAWCVLASQHLPVSGYRTRALKTRQVYGFATHETRRTHSPYKTVTNARYKMDCLVDCASSITCVAVDHFDQTCLFYDVLPALGEDETLTHSLVLMRGLFVMNVNTVADFNPRYNYTYSEAQQTCKDRGARLATRTELQTLFDTGYDLCACGWVAGGEAIYPAQWARMGCGNNVGLIRCNWNTSFNAWCSFV